MKVLACGPFFGTFKNEFMTFRPYSAWLSEVVEHNKMYVCSHINRSFLYKNVEFVPIFENLSRNENNQKGYIHTDTQQCDFNMMVKRLKEIIIEKEGCVKRDIDLYNLGYVKTTPHYSIFNKIFNKINNIDVNVNEGKIVFIPSNIENKEVLAEVYNYLMDNHDVIVIGDMNTYFKKHNEVLSQIDYFENGWKMIVKYISTAKAVICPASHWTVIANVQNIPVFSWGENVSQYKENGIYNFDNKKCFALAKSKDSDTNILLNMLKYFFEELE